MKFVIVTGMSGAGKSTALKMLEDMGYFCVDNLPIALLPKFAELAHAPGSDISQVAVGVDIRNGRSLDEMASVLENLKASGVAYQILYLEASDRGSGQEIQGDEACPSPGQTGPGGGWYPPPREKSFFI